MTSYRLLVAALCIACALACGGVLEDPTLLTLAEGEVVYIAVDAAGRNALHRHRAGQPDVLIPPQAAPIIGFSFSHDGSRVAVAQRDGPIRIVALDGSSTSEFVARGSSPSWAPDGRRLAYVLDEEVWTARPDGSGAVGLRVTASRVAWSPTGDNLVAWDVRGIRVVDPRGSEVASADRTGAANVVWSPDGTRLAFDQGGDIYLMSLTGHLTHLVRREDFETAPSWSPDGTSIAFQALEPGNSDWPYLAIAPTDGAKRKALWARGYKPVWSPDGSALAYTFEGHIHLTRLDGATAQLTSGDQTERDVRWMPAGRL
jgi:Tol biopolymer transport system component